MKRARISVHIERLVLDGLPIERRQGPAVRAAVEAELARMLAEGSIGEEFMAGGAVASIPAERMEFDETSQPGSIGKSVAGAVYRGLSR